MELPRPEARIADCVWLPRLLAKCRAFHAGQLPEDYVVRLGHTTGVDGQFLRHFGVSKEQVLEITKGSDAAVLAWFQSLASATPESITTWNQVAINLGRPGSPMAERLPIALRTSYSHLAHRNFQTVFEVLNADEGHEA